jgi:bacteriocin leader peptide (microcyclamide/patellamide family)
MNKQNLMPQAAQPVHRTSTGQIPPELAELSEEALSLGVAPSSITGASGMGVEASGGWVPYQCSYDGDNAE